MLSRSFRRVWPTWAAACARGRRPGVSVETAKRRLYAPSGTKMFLTSKRFFRTHATQWVGLPSSPVAYVWRHPRTTTSRVTDRVGEQSFISVVRCALIRSKSRAATDAANFASTIRSPLSCLPFSPAASSQEVPPPPPPAAASSAKRHSRSSTSQKGSERCFFAEANNSLATARRSAVLTLSASPCESPLVSLHGSRPPPSPSLSSLSMRLILPVSIPSLLFLRPPHRSQRR
ncbi:uncharacterized protein Tco025E_00063 [Trypanosoma conorhini]|uniref:Uncharacterized protein n=1 Tax=Trypanosoma conorhini TaxID=83891 RepID=A0A422QCK7_9TRYP|nr:uncharacterized protein Tco025E_00063 [Trypanosoma conorhini]RNF27679.1 hypothetical protein Tco025E_00063 [Trypanosoma conorhini]